MIFRILHWLSRIILGGTFLYSGYLKLQNPLQFAAALTGYQLFPDGVIIPVTYYFPWVEIALGVFLLVGWKLRYFAVGTLGLLSFFIIILSITYARGINADCGCFGPGGPISPLTLARDVAFLLPAAFLAFESNLRQRWQSQVP
jgi:uncharacterized membrane protein YphA (DoxX/SURF4 family)